MGERTEPARMRPWSVRTLTAGEMRLAKLVFAAALPLEGLKVRQIPKGLGFGAMVPLGRAVVFSSWPAATDFAAAPVGEQGWFIHELAHVWQAQVGVTLALAKLGALGRDAYRLKIVPDKPFASYNIEQQAEIARFVFHGRLGAPHKDGPNPLALEALWPFPRPA